VPLETAAACAAVAELALAMAERGNTNAASDAGIAALLAEAGCIGASYNVRINVVALSDRSLGAALELEARQLVQKAAELSRLTSQAVERVLAG
jgi:glutamate formiminotransferase/formiminotetrahydrofolate cyclodeaminase